MAVRVRGTDLTITVTINNKPTVSLKPSRICSFMFVPVAGKGSFLTAVPSPPLLRATISSVPLAAFTRAGKNFSVLCGGPGMCNCNRPFCCLAVCSPRLPLRSGHVICESSLSVRCMPITPVAMMSVCVSPPAPSRHEARCKREKRISQSIWPAQLLLLLTHYNCTVPGHTCLLAA